jgi:hypothetical protein
VETAVVVDKDGGAHLAFLVSLPINCTEKPTLVDVIWSMLEV